MAQSVGIFRRISQRPFQVAIRQKFVVEPWTAPVVPEDVQSIVFPHKPFRNPEPRFQQQQRRVPSIITAPGILPPGWIEAVRARTERYPKLLFRERFDYKAAAKAKFFTPATQHGIPGVPRSIHKKPIQQRRERAQSLPPRRFVSTLFIPPSGEPAPGWNRRRMPRPHKVQRFMFRKLLFITSKVEEVVPGHDLGWLVSWITKRAYGHNIRR